MANEKNTLTAQARAKAGKGAARAVRRAGAIPAVVYGGNKQPILLSISQQELRKGLAKKGFLTHLCDLVVDGTTHLVLPRDIQLDPVSDQPVHADFLRVTEKTVIRVQVPVRVINHKDSPGLTKGGVLNLVHHEVEVYCPATAIPEEFIVDLKGIEVGRSVHIEDLGLPKNVQPVAQGNFTVATLVAPSAMKSETEAAAAGGAAAATPAAPAATAAKAPAAKAAPAKDAGKGGKK